LQDHAVIPEQRTAVPVEWDDVRAQLQRLANTLRPTEPGGVSTLGSLVHTTADNLRVQGAAIRDSIIKLSETLSARGYHKVPIFHRLQNLPFLVSALQTAPTSSRTQPKPGVGDGVVCQQPR
jgi:phospholipid/cholesterol/gamma-HCH transport system substrate-binding protein